MSVIPLLPANQNAALEKLAFILQHRLDAVPGTASAQSGETVSSAIPPVASQDNALEKISIQLSEFLKDHNNQLHFTVDQQTGDVVISVVNQKTKEIISHIPIDQLTLDKAQIRDLNNLFLHVQV